jgi:dipeptidyl-peptidase-4
MRGTQPDSDAGYQSVVRRQRIALTVSLVAGFAASSLLAAMPREDQQESAVELLKRTLGKEFQLKLPPSNVWLENGEGYLTLEPSAGTAGAQDIVRYETATGTRRVMVAAAQLIPPDGKKPFAIDGYSMSPDERRVLVFTNTETVWREKTRGDYWVLDLTSGALHKLGVDAPPSSLMFAKFSPDSSKVGYVRANNLYTEDLSTGTITQLTSDGSKNIINGTSDWVSEEEFDIRDGFEWSPDSRHLAFWQFNTTDVQSYTLIYDLGHPRGEILTEIPYQQVGLYSQTLQYPYPEPGTQNSAVRVGIVSTTGGPIVWVKTSGDSSNNYISYSSWADASSLVLQHINRLQNSNEVLLADAATGTPRRMFLDEDPTWVERNLSIPWIAHGREFLFLSERDGWRHLYRIAREGGATKLVTHGNYDVVTVERVSPDEQWVYFIASPDNATQRYLFRTRLDGSGAMERLTTQEHGTHSYDMSPDGQWAFHTYSSFDTPPVSDLVHLPDHRIVRVMAENSALGDRVRPLTDGPTEFTKLNAGHGLMVDAWVIKPPHFDPTKKYPLIVNVYSEPAAQTTEDRWGPMFDRVLSNAGYLVASIDNQGTPAPRGREWRKIVYGNIGPLSSEQQATALQSLEKSHPYIDSNRIGVWGWSGGGTETLNLMFRYPGLYDVGVAVASVPDQRLYDSIYQERYMGLPQDNAKAYMQSSAINYAGGLRGRLMIIHGSGDDNVHFQGFELLVNKLISLGKQFDMRVYPGRTHSISEGEGTRLDVYSQILDYFEHYLPSGPQQHLDLAKSD